MSRILVLPRAPFAKLARFTHWRDQKIEELALDLSWQWMDRKQAESSYEWIQPIPCSLLLNCSDKLGVLKRGKSDRRDLDIKISLLVGGHIDEIPGISPRGTTLGHSFLSILTATLERELHEEMGIMVDLKNSEPIGVVNDARSLESSRHVAFVFETQVSSRLRPRAAEEFMLHSRYTKRFYSIAEVCNLRDKLDPWSTVLVEERLAPRIPVQGHLRFQ